MSDVPAKEEEIEKEKEIEKLEEDLEQENKFVLQTEDLV